MILSPLRHATNGSRWRILADNSDYEAGLVYYPAEVEHADHEHARGQLSFLLCGGFEEEAEGRASAPQGNRHGYKPPGARHACRFGRNGALILSINFREGVADAPAPTTWSPTGKEAEHLYGLLFDQCVTPEDAIADLMGSVTAPAINPDPARAPAWLRQVAERFSDEPLAEVGEVAGAHGIHRVQLSRAFQKHMGVSPSRFRLHCKAARAVRLMIEEGETPGMAAIGAGFADQAHLTRTTRALSGLGPARLRRLLAA